MPELIISRAQAARGFLLKFSVLLDGKEIGRLGNGQSIRVNISRGTHNLTLDPRSRMVRTLTLNGFKVGSSNVHVDVAPTDTDWRLDATGAENDSPFPQLVGPMSQALLSASAELAASHLPCWYSMRETHVELKYYYSGTHTTTERYDYSDLSAGGIYRLDHQSQTDLATVFGRYLYGYFFQTGQKVIVNAGGTGVHLKSK